jgi:uncharacterized protein (DUF1015 family)
MTPLAMPFRALRPTLEHAADVIAPPYDVVNLAEARALAQDRPYSFLHISRPEIDFPEGTDPHADAVHAHGADTLRRLGAEEILVREEAPCYYVYRLSMAEHRQTGIALTASVRAYEANTIKKHELTRPEKETDRVRNITALNAQTGPVLCAYRDDAVLRELVDAAVDSAPLFSVQGPNAVTHTLWRIAEPESIGTVTAAFGALDALYIADGHHRSAAAARVAAARRTSGEPSLSAQYFLTVAFPDADMRILEYNRVIRDLGKLSIAEFRAAVAAEFEVADAAMPVKPERPNEFGMYLEGQWFRLSLRRAPASTDPVAHLDVSLLQQRLIEPILGIGDPRIDPRIDFIGGIRGLGELERRVDSGSAAVAFSLFPTSMSELMAVADAERLMPPKSTWFEPKLADGLLSHVLD